MNQVRFAEMNEEHLLGEWKVQSRILSRSNPHSHVAEASKHIFLTSGVYMLQNHKELAGTWMLTNKGSLINNPLIKFVIPEEGALNAIITKLLYSADQKHGQVTLYFSTGLELVLTKN